MNGISSPATKSLTIRYLLALFAIAMTCLASQLVVQSLLDQAQTHAQLVNIAGRQRMLSQRIAKVTHQLAADHRGGAVQSLSAELRSSAQELSLMHRVIRDGDGEIGLPRLQNEPAREQLAAIHPLLQSLVVSADRLTQLVDTNRLDSDAERQLVGDIQMAESQFLLGMDRFVSLVSDHSSNHILYLISVQRWITFATLMLLLLEAVFVFRPAVRRTGDAIQGLRLALSHARSATIDAELAVADRNVALSAAAMDLKRLSSEIDALLLEQVALAAPRDGHRFRMLVAHVQGTLRKLTDLAVNGDDDDEQLVVSRTSPRVLVNDAIQTFRRKTGDDVEVGVTMDVRVPASLLVDEQLFKDSIVYLLQSIKDSVGPAMMVHLGYDDRDLQLIVEIKAAIDCDDHPTQGDLNENVTSAASSSSDAESLDLLLAKRTLERLGGTVLSSLHCDQITVRLPLDETKRMTLFADGDRLQEA